MERYFLITLVRSETRFGEFRKEQVEAYTSLVEQAGLKKK